MLSADHYSFSEIEDIVNKTDNIYTVQFLTKNKNKHRQLKEISGYNVEYIFDNLLNKYDINSEKYEDSDEVMNILRSVLNDENTHLFYDRPTTLMNFGTGVHNYFKYISDLVFKEYVTFKTYQPDCVFFVSSPHQIESWIKARVAELLSIKVLIIHKAPLPGRKYVMEGLGRTPELCNINSDICNETSNEVDEFVSKVQSDYRIAIPDYEKKRLKRNKGKYFNFKQELLRWWKKPHFIYNKYKCYQRYKELSIKPEFNKKVITFFLHYQPERTTLPEGYGFTQQIIAIKALRMAVPDDTEILVKEHPSTFTNQCNPKVRHSSLYDSINRIKGVSLVNLDITPFELIDKSILVGTITGNVGVEALIRGKPVVYFGVSVIQDFKWAHSYVNQKELVNFINNINEYENINDVIKSDTVKILYNSLNNSIPLNNEDDYSISGAMRLRNIKIIKYLINGYIKV